MKCDNYCSHGGVCSLDNEHEGQHESWGFGGPGVGTKYCSWDSKDSVSREEADNRLRNNAPTPEAADLVLGLYDFVVPKKNSSN